MKQVNKRNPLIVKAVNRETYISIIVTILFFTLFGSIMGVKNMFGTMFNTAHDLIINTVLYIMGVAVLTGAFSAILSEFGIIALINKVLSPLMKPIYGLPGASSLGIITTYLSDSPAIIALGNDKGFIKYFTFRQRALLTNLATTFGMGLIVATFMLGLSRDTEMTMAVFCGNIAAVFASVISVRLMNIFAKKYYGKEGDKLIKVESDDTEFDLLKERKIRPGGMVNRVMCTLLDGGKTGVQLGLDIIPGNIIICTFVMMLVKGVGPDGMYTGAAMEGIGLLPLLASKIWFILDPLFGFLTPEAIAFPATAVGSVGASLGMVPDFLKNGLIGANDIAVFTAMGMSYSGYLSVHVAMMDALDSRELATKAILSHTIAGLCAGIMAHWLFVLAATFI
ncbi:CD0519/CD1768 family membrane protein [Maledivibacter halophilus]|uniref:Nucleoside recognition n=1 Tax=Maledivibacter halophilus TaxID=36842 RepID=A0A1T5M9F7_9FIRM|nr:hypothetical protein [Maledivibacter halophilus]SKC84499.1 hypothetical protein SAMN02194393_04136 [Maledivibacter halophilus]